MMENRSKICCLVLLSKTSNYGYKKLFNKKREGGMKEVKEGNFNSYSLSLQFLRFILLVFLQYP